METKDKKGKSIYSLYYIPNIQKFKNPQANSLGYSGDELEKVIK